ncbi:LPXTG cell wall anchor domain-containing protein [Actinoplanes sp. NPDC026623]|uniref:LPXTG cell wall anchor domain-containing protein n=1 Tax=Actinoplanes sp. NPDC026623 TaxID=3155610 RepID=UPI0034105141
MSFTRRLAAGLPAAGVTVIAALALTGSPAAATGDESAARANQPAVMTTPCADVPQGEQCETTSAVAVAPGAPGDIAAAPDAGAPDADAADADVAPARGNGGYGPVPSASVLTTPPAGELPETSPAATPSKPSGVSAGTLPLTGAPMGLTMAIGGMLVAGGAAAVYYSRRRRSA